MSDIRVLNGPQGTKVIDVDQVSWLDNGFGTIVVRNSANEVTTLVVVYDENAAHKEVPVIEVSLPKKSPTVYDPEHPAMA